MKLISTAVCAVAALAAGSAFAGDNPAWTWGQVSYDQYTSGDSNSYGLGIDGSMGIADLFHVQIGYTRATEGMDVGSDIDTDLWRITAGVHPHVGAKTDAVFNIRYVDGSPDSPYNDFNMWGVGAGLRHMLFENVELNGMINIDRGSEDHTSNGDWTAVSWTVGGRYLITPEISAGISYTDNSSGGGFYSFGGGAATLDLRYQFADIL